MSRSKVVLACLVMLAVSCGLCQAGWIPTPGTEPIRLSELQGRPFVVGDKVFSDFDVFAFAGGGAIAPSPETIFVQGGHDDVTGDYGLFFQFDMNAFSGMNAGSGQTVNLNLNFAVSVMGEVVGAPSPWLIKDVSLILSDASATSSGIVSVSETVWGGPIPSALLASLSASKQTGDQGVNMTDAADFDPVKVIWVRKDISVTGGVYQDGSGHLSGMFQFYSQVPEPFSMTVLLAGAIPVLWRARRK